MKVNSNKLTKGVLIFSFLLVAFSVFYYCVIFLPQKEETRLEQRHKEYVAKRKGECYDIVQRERKKYSNVVGGRYYEERDVCIVAYKTDEYEGVNCAEKYKDNFTMEFECISGRFTKEF